MAWQDVISGTEPYSVEMADRLAFFDQLPASLAGSNRHASRRAIQGADASADFLAQRDVFWRQRMIATAHGVAVPESFWDKSRPTGPETRNRTIPDCLID